MRTFVAAVVSATCLFVAGPALAADKAPPKSAVDLAPSLAAYAADPVLVEAVKAQNAKGQTVEQAKEIQKKWMATRGLDDFMKTVLKNPASDKLRAIMKEKPIFVEAYLMDKNGSNVAMGAKTSNYWRGEAAKFKASYKGGKGAIFVSPVYFDDSSQLYQTQISVPVMDGATAIGVLTLGIDVAKLPK